MTYQTKNPGRKYIYRISYTLERSSLRESLIVEERGLVTAIESARNIIEPTGVNLFPREGDDVSFKRACWVSISQTYKPIGLLN